MTRSFLAYRFFVGITLLLLLYFGFEGSFLGSYTYRLYAWTAWAYLFLLLGSALIYLRYSGSCEHQAYLMVFIDIPAITLLTHASGGITTGLGLLLTVSIAFGGAIMRGRAVLVFSSIASLAVITAEIYADLRGSFPQTHYTQAGFMGLSFFAMAILAETMVRKLRESERVITQRELDLADLAQLNQHIIQRIETGIVVVDLEARVRLFNEAAFRLLGMPEIRVGRPLKVLSSDLARLFERFCAGGELQMHPFSPAGAAHNLQPHFIPLGREQRQGALIFLDDVSEIAEKAHRMKLASLGRLVASIAHEVRNPLGAISHAEQLLSESQNLDRSDRRLTTIIHQHSGRVNGIIEDMLTLSRGGMGSPEEIDLELFVAEFIEEARTQYQLEAESLALSSHQQGIEVTADRSQFRQILDNLVGNAVHHASKEGARLEIRIVIGLSSQFGNPYLDVCDNGPGIAPDTVEHIFDPFFTTSPSGTGLGLFVTKELCEVNRMRLEYCDPPGGGPGGCFRLIFPTRTSEVTR